MAQDIELQNSYLVVNKEYKEDKFLFTILNESETNIFNAKVVRYTGKKILIDGLIENKEYCISEYKYDNNNNLTGSERSSIVAKNSKLFFISWCLASCYMQFASLMCIPQWIALIKY